MSLVSIVRESVQMVDRIGQRFGDYHLTHWLGGGGFGDVYLHVARPRATNKA